MTLQGDYEPSRAQWVRDQVEAYERSGGREANTLRDTGLPVIVVTMRGNKTGKVRKIALMRVEHDGEYALGRIHGRSAPQSGLVPQPQGQSRRGHDSGRRRAVRRSGARGHGTRARRWWDRAVAAYPPYAEYQERTERQIPVLIASRPPDADN